MIAVDTNLLVRLMTEDDPAQAQRAAKIMQRDEIFIPKSVMLEMEWVLRHAYGIDRDTICTGFQKLMGLPNVSVEDWQAVFQAILWYRSGFDFADALHLSSSGHADKFVTFDKDFAKKALEVKAIDVILA